MNLFRTGCMLATALRAAADPLLATKLGEVLADDPQPAPTSTVTSTYWVHPCDITYTFTTTSPKWLSTTTTRRAIPCTTHLPQTQAVPEISTYWLKKTDTEAYALTQTHLEVIWDTQTTPLTVVSLDCTSTEVRISSPVTTITNVLFRTEYLRVMRTTISTLCDYRSPASSLPGPSTPISSSISSSSSTLRTAASEAPASTSLHSTSIRIVTVPYTAVENNFLTTKILSTMSYTTYRCINPTSTVTVTGTWTITVWTSTVTLTSLSDCRIDYCTSALEDSLSSTPRPVAPATATIETGLVTSNAADAGRRRQEMSPTAIATQVAGEPTTQTSLTTTTTYAKFATVTGSGPWTTLTIVCNPSLTFNRSSLVWPTYPTV
jgi:hypothetical protein